MNTWRGIIHTKVIRSAYGDGKLSLGKAAEVAGVWNKWEMVLLLNEKCIPIDYTAKDAEKDLETLKKALGR